MPTAGTSGSESEDGCKGRPPVEYVELSLGKSTISVIRGPRWSLLGMYVAAPDIGARSLATIENFYPFGIKGDVGLFKIAAATVDGIPMPMPGPIIDFSLPEHKVEGQHRAGDSARSMLQPPSPQADKDKDDTNDGLKTGSSIATALRAGQDAARVREDGGAVGRHEVGRQLRRHLALVQGPGRLAGAQGVAVG
jgi:hypothetical protein